MDNQSKKLLLYSLVVDVADMVLDQNPNIDTVYYEAYKQIQLTGLNAIKCCTVQCTKAKLNKIKKVINELYVGGIKFDVLELFSIAYLGISDIYYLSINKKAASEPAIIGEAIMNRLKVKYQDLLSMMHLLMRITHLYDPDLLEQEKYEVAYNKYIEWKL